MKDYVNDDEKFQSNHTMYYKEPTPAWNSGNLEFS